MPCNNYPCLISMAFKLNCRWIWTWPLQQTWYNYPLMLSFRIHYVRKWGLRSQQPVMMTTWNVITRIGINIIKWGTHKRQKGDGPLSAQPNSQAGQPSDLQYIIGCVRNDLNCHTNVKMLPIISCIQTVVHVCIFSLATWNWSCKMPCNGSFY